MIARRERVENTLGTIGLLAVCAIFAEIIALAVAGKIGSQTGRNVAALALGVTIFVVIPVCCIATKLNRLRDGLIVAEIKRRLEGPLKELFELERAGQRFTIGQFMAWRDEYISKLEEGHVGSPVDMWIRIVKQGELPGAQNCRRRFPRGAILVEAAMSLAFVAD